VEIGYVRRSDVSVVFDILTKDLQATLTSFQGWQKLIKYGGDDVFAPIIDQYQQMKKRSSPTSNSTSAKSKTDANALTTGQPSGSANGLATSQLGGLADGEVCPVFPVPVSKLPPVSGNGSGGSGGTGSDAGDVHLTTFDGLHYDFQAAGEFILAQSTVPGDSFLVQARMQPWYNGVSVSITTMVAVQVGSDRVTIGLGRSSPVWVDGHAFTLPSNDAAAYLPAGAGTIRQLTSTSYQITEGTGETVTIGEWGDSRGQTLYATISGPPGAVQGLLGTDSGNLANEFVLPNGTVLQQPLSYSDLYTTWANAWRVTQSSSLFDYGPGQTTATFTDVNFPSDAAETGTLPASALAAAEALVAQAGITDPGLALGAAEDYLATGDTSFIQGAARLQGTVNTTAIAAPPLNPNATGGVGVFTHSDRVSNGLDSGHVHDLSDRKRLLGSNGQLPGPVPYNLLSCRRQFSWGRAAERAGDACRRSEQHEPDARRIGQHRKRAAGTLAAANRQRGQRRAGCGADGQRDRCQCAGGRRQSGYSYHAGRDEWQRDI
jgi:hypothetical protein